MRGGTVCSGIGAPEVAAPWVDWRFCSEIDRFASAVLAERFPGVPNRGDMTLFKEWPDDAIDLLVGGTPCQSFSVAGLRAGLSDPRGNLALTYLAIAAAHRPRWLVWENVPGVLSSGGGRDFGSFLGALGQLGYGFAYRVLDAQYVRARRFPRAVPQRRRRVFVVGYLGDWRRAAAVLFDRESLSGNPPPRREAGKGTAGCSGDGAGGDGGPEPVTFDWQAGGGGADTSFRGKSRSYVVDKPGCARSIISNRTLAVARPLTAPRTGYRCDAETETLVAFSCKDHGADAVKGVTPTLRAMGHAGSHANAGGQLAVASDIKGGLAPHGSVSLTDTTSSILASDAKDPKLVAVAFTQNSRSEVRLIAGDGSATGAIAAQHGVQQQNYIAAAHAVRRLTPRECERLQGFPDDWTLIPWRGKSAEACPDGPRYKALGNSMAINCMELILDRLRFVDERVGQGRPGA